MRTQQRRGQGLVEYALTIAAVTIFVLISMIFLRAELQSAFGDIATSVDGPRRWCAWSMADGHVYATHSSNRDCLRYDESRVHLVKGVTIDEALGGGGVIVRLEGRTLLQRASAGAVIALEPSSPLFKRLEAPTD